MSEKRKRDFGLFETSSIASFLMAVFVAALIASPMVYYLFFKD